MTVNVGETNQQEILSAGLKKKGQAPAQILLNRRIANKVSIINQINLF